MTKFTNHVPETPHFATPVENRTNTTSLTLFATVALLMLAAGGLTTSTVTVVCTTVPRQLKALTV